jgi:hypothetical protein
VYFGVWYFHLWLWNNVYHYNNKICIIIIINIVTYVFFFLFQLYSEVTSRSYEVLSLCKLLSPSTRNDLKCEERRWVKD